ncbi:hypothetical protein DVH24_001955 [Malus domestica]|uniref:Asn/Gln amidotransferase domain-containing protein n=1 Tax=Malus domestica TaxID=3750 RepID=A0A498I8X3_MALDO|nr:hypothetical protein DVH24_001955 [Malus domestica]
MLAIVHAELDGLAIFLLSVLSISFCVFEPDVFSVSGCFPKKLLQEKPLVKFFDTTITKGADVKLATNWIMGDVAAYMKNEKLTINEIKLSPQELAELIASIKDGTISGKIGKEFDCSTS